MSLVVVDPQRDARWCALVEQCASSVFHSPAWLRVLADTYDLEVRAWLVLDECGKPQAGLPFCRHSDLKGERIVILPFSDYCDPLVKEQTEWNSLIEKLAEERCSISIRCVHNRAPLADERFVVVNRAKWHGMDLRPDVEEIWRRLPEATRRAIKKAKQSGITVQAACHPEELREFFRLHLGVRKHKYRLLAQPYSFFENIWRQFIDPQCGVLLVAKHQGEIIGSVLFLEWRDGLYYKFNASAADHLSLRPNDLLIWEGVRYAKERGYRHLDFGLSDWDQEGLIRFKRKFATEEKTISFLKYERETANGQTHQFQSLLPQLTALFTTNGVPDVVTERAGELLYRFFI